MTPYNSAASESRAGRFDSRLSLGQDRRAKNETGRIKWMVAGQRYTVDLYAECWRTTTGKRAKTLLA